MSRVRAPEFRGGEWINSGGRQFSLRELRGRWVVLDFWTGACVNCLHVIEELRPLETRVTVLGVHSPKFDHEADRATVEAAIERYGVRHPVYSDPDRYLWDQYAVSAWPTLVLVDPEGYVVRQVSGEGHVAELAALVGDDEQLTITGGTTPAPDSALRFPGGVLALPNGDVLVSDTGHDQLVVLGADLTTEKARVGSGERGTADGDARAAAFSAPLGTVLLPPEAAALAGYDVVVADSVSHRLRGVRLADGEVTTLATGLRTPWDLAWFEGEVVIAMAGLHQLWAFDVLAQETRVLAGTGQEGLVDGPAARSWFSQPSGLSAPDDGTRLWVADAEASAVRLLTRTENGLQVRTVVGQGLFEFGRVDGPADDARLQHPLGVAVLPDGSVAIADTYNGAVRRYDPVAHDVSTMADGLAEPAALALSHGTLVVAESAGHRLSRVDAGADDAPRILRRTVVEHPLVDLAPGAVSLVVRFEPPPGQHLDDREGDPTRLTVSAVPAGVLTAGAGGGTGLERELRFDGPLTGGRVDGVLRVGVQAAACDIDGGPGAACHLFRRDWEVPFRLVPGSATELELVLTHGLPDP
jgi:thiol-disulfide isomerase/thioredoxin